MFKSEECELADGRIVNRRRTAFVTVVYVKKGLFGGGKMSNFSYSVVSLHF